MQFLMAQCKDTETKQDATTLIKRVEKQLLGIKVVLIRYVVILTK